jgi:K+-transporting ATPase ATPase B chain
MFVVLVGQRADDGPLAAGARRRGEARPGFILAISLWLWFTVLFANFAEAMAEGRGKAQADTLRKARRDITARKLDRAPTNGAFDPKTATIVQVTSGDLRKGHLVLVEAASSFPSDGEIVVGIASVDEERDHRRERAVIRRRRRPQRGHGGTRVLSDWIVIRVSADPGETFLDRMIAMVEGAKRQRRRTRSRSTSCSPASRSSFCWPR